MIFNIFLYIYLIIFGLIDSTSDPMTQYLGRVDHRSKFYNYDCEQRLSSRLVYFALSGLARKELVDTLSFLPRGALDTAFSYNMSCFIEI